MSGSEQSKGRELTTRVRIDLPILLHWSAMPPDHAENADVGKDTGVLSPFYNFLLLEAKSMTVSEDHFEGQDQC